MSDSLQSHGPLPARLLGPWDSLGKKTRVGCHTLLQGIFLTQGLNPSLMSSAPADLVFTITATWEAHLSMCKVQKICIKECVTQMS